MDSVRLTAKLFGTVRRCSALFGVVRDCSGVLAAARTVFGGIAATSKTLNRLMCWELFVDRCCWRREKLFDCSALFYYYIGRTVPNSPAGHPSPTPPPLRRPCGGGAGWRRCCLRERFSKSEPLRGWGALPTRQRIFRPRPGRVDVLHKFASGRARNPAENGCRAKKALANQAVVGAKNVLLLTRRCGIVATKHA
jgi:hypothetical protein